MDQNDVILAAMAAGNRAEHTPVQIQKLLFLVDKRVAGDVGGPFFSFDPYHYGPYDPTIFDRLRILEAKGFVQIHRVRDRNWKSYSLTESGYRQGMTLLNALDAKVRDYLYRLSSYVRSKSFAELVSAVYDAYPDMKANSVFAG
jgi:hypothetical protein